MSTHPLTDNPDIKPLSDERIAEIIAEAEAAQQQVERRNDHCSCCGKMLDRNYDVPTECPRCVEETLGL